MKDPVMNAFREELNRMAAASMAAGDAAMKAEYLDATRAENMERFRHAHAADSTNPASHGGDARSARSGVRDHLLVEGVARSAELMAQVVARLDTLIELAAGVARLDAKLDRLAALQSGPPAAAHAFPEKETR